MLIHAYRNPAGGAPSAALVSFERAAAVKSVGAKLAIPVSGNYARIFVRYGTIRSAVRERGSERAVVSGPDGVA